MEEIAFPPSPNWFLRDVMVCREDGTLAYGSQNYIIILKTGGGCRVECLNFAHEDRINALAFSPPGCDKRVENTIVSCSDDGFVKLWNLDTLTGTIAHKSHWVKSGPAGKVVSVTWSRASPEIVMSVAENCTMISWNVLSNTTTIFYTLKVSPTTMLACPHREKVVAVGTKTGLVFVFKLVGKGELLFKFRGHEKEVQSLSWCPVPYNLLELNPSREHLLASASRERDVGIWRTGSDGRCEVMLQLPQEPFSREVDRYGSNTGAISFAAVHWADPLHLYCSSAYGELIFFDLESYLKDLAHGNLRPKVKGSKAKFYWLFKHAHNGRGLFSIAAVPYGGELRMLKEGQKKGSAALAFRIPWDIVTDNDNKGLVWTTSVQDRKLVAYHRQSNELVYNLHTFNGFVVCAVVSPHDPNRIAIGVGDGTIRLWNLTDPLNEMHYYWQKIKDKVMCLAWHPGKEGVLAYGTSEGRVGVVETHSNRQPLLLKLLQPRPVYVVTWGTPHPSANSNFDSSDFALFAVTNHVLAQYNSNKPFAEPLNLNKLLDLKLPTDVAWKGDYSAVAVGQEDGTVNVFTTDEKEWHLVEVLHPYRKAVQCLTWHPLGVTMEPDVSRYHGYFTMAGLEMVRGVGTVHVYNLLKASDSGAASVEKVASLVGHQGAILTVAWSPHMGARLASASGDLSVQIWDVATQTPLVNYCPCASTLLFTIWSPVDPDLIISGGKSHSIQVWRISDKENLLPVYTVKDHNKTRLKETRRIFQMGTLDNEVEGAVKKTKKSKSKKDDDREQKREQTNFEMASTRQTLSREKRWFLQSWKFTPDELNSCYLLLKNDDEHSKKEFRLGFLGSEESVKKTIEEFDQSTKLTSEKIPLYYTALWRGEIKELIEAKIKSKEMDEHLLCMAPMVSPRLWQEACLSYAQRLAEGGQVRKAASFYLLVHRFTDAIQVLVEADALCEALCLARCRLPDRDPVVLDIVRKYAQALLINGNYSRAGECYLYLNEYTDAALAFGKNFSAPYQQCAALSAKKAGNTQLETQFALGALGKCFANDLRDIARAVFEEHPNLGALKILYIMYNKIQELEKSECLDLHVLDHVTEAAGLQEEEKRIACLVLKPLFNPQVLFRDKPQMWIAVAQELCCACCAANIDVKQSHLIRALFTCSRLVTKTNDSDSFLYKLCSWLAPTGFLVEESIFRAAPDASDNIRLKLKSLRGYLCIAVIEKASRTQINAEERQTTIDLLKELKDDLLDVNNFNYYRNLVSIKMSEKRMIQLMQNKKKCKPLSTSNSQQEILRKKSEEVEVEKDCKNTEEPESADVETQREEDMCASLQEEMVRAGSAEIEIEEDFKNTKEIESTSIDVNEQEGICTNDVENKKLPEISHSHEITDGDSAESEIQKVESRNGTKSDVKTIDNNVNIEPNSPDTPTQDDLELSEQVELESLRKLKADINEFEETRISAPNPVTSYCHLRNLCQMLLTVDESAKDLMKEVEMRWATFASHDS